MNIKTALKNVDWLRLANRVVAVATLLSGDATLLHLIPGRPGIVITTVLGVIASTGPRVLKAAGILRPVAPGELSVYQTVLNTINGFITARKDQKAQATLSSLTAFVPLLATLVAEEQDKSRKMDAEALAAGIAAKKAEVDVANQAQADATPGAAVEAAPPTPETDAEEAPAVEETAADAA